VKQLRLHTSKELKRVVIDTHYLNVLEIMNRYEQEKANDLKRIAVALEKLTKLLTQVIKDNA
tara:strand:+ start:35 stop:220 length:186 start_codon:yes stop_codon:yes gene_type:complete